jgi:curved DNA-binding protein CbpA
VSSDRKKRPTNSQSTTLPKSTQLTSTYYDVLGLHPAASVVDIRRSYRRLSKKYHPDTTKLTSSVATSKFQRLNEAYATLSSPERRSLYDLKIGYSRINVIQAPKGWEDESTSNRSSTAYLDPTDRPLSSGEIFVLFLLGCTFIGCLLLVVVVAYIRGDSL